MLDFSNVHYYFQMADSIHLFKEKILIKHWWQKKASQRLLNRIAILLLDIGSLNDIRYGSIERMIRNDLFLCLNYLQVSDFV